MTTLLTLVAPLAVLVATSTHAADARCANGRWLIDGGPLGVGPLTIGEVGLRAGKPVLDTSCRTARWALGRLDGATALRALFICRVPDEVRRRRFALRLRARITDGWRTGRRLYVRNLFTWAPTPFFNTGLVVDADGSIHPNNLGLSGALEELLDETRVGTLEQPPSREVLAAKAEQVNALLASRLPEAVWESTLAVDRELTRFCRQLYPEYVAYRRRRKAA